MFSKSILKIFFLVSKVLITTGIGIGNNIYKTKSEIIDLSISGMVILAIAISNWLTVVKQNIFL